MWQARYYRKYAVLKQKVSNRYRYILLSSKIFIQTIAWGICILCIRTSIIARFFPSGTSLVRTFVRNVGWGGHSSTVGVTLPEVWARSVQCVAYGKPFKLLWPWAHLRQIPGDWVSAPPIPVYARKILMQTRFFCSKKGTRTFPSFCTEHHATILPPSSSPAP